MATVIQNHGVTTEELLRRKIAAAVRSVHWSYAIFWSISTKQQGVLEWSDGYYNGDIKTRKMVQSVDFNTDQTGLQRSEQLRELYGSLSVSENNQQAKRPSAALSPEDLTDLEWYYLVCMSFTFNPGQGLPGRALTNGQYIWVSNAHCAQSKAFSRSLLAKSASIQTVACLPLMGGVLELGVTEIISEDPTVIQHITTTFLEFQPVFPERSISSPCNADNTEEDPPCNGHEHKSPTSLPEFEIQTEDDPTTFPFSFPSFTPKEEVEHYSDCIEEVPTNELRAGSLDDASDGPGVYQNFEDGLNGNFQVQSLLFMDDENVNSSDCISQSFVNAEKYVFCEKANNPILEEIEACDRNKFRSSDVENQESHYLRTLEVIFRNSQCLGRKPFFYDVSHQSSFMSWRRYSDTPKLHISNRTSQKMLKKILLDVPQMNGCESFKSLDDKGGSRIDLKLGECVYSENHVLCDRREEKLNEKFEILQSLVPSLSKVDMASTLGDTIEYLKELERRVDELEANKESSESEARERRKNSDIVERTSDNYRHDEVANGKRLFLNKRKASDIDELDDELEWISSKDKLADVTVKIADKEVSIEMKCLWRECLLHELVEEISNIHLDAREIHSSVTDGVLSLKLKSKFSGAAVVSAWMIKETLQRVVAKC